MLASIRKATERKPTVQQQSYNVKGMVSLTEFPVGNARDDAYSGEILPCAPYRLGENDWQDKTRDVYGVNVQSRANGYPDR